MSTVMEKRRVPIVAIILNLMISQPDGSLLEDRGHHSRLATRKGNRNTNWQSTVELEPKEVDHHTGRQRSIRSQYPSQTGLEKTKSKVVVYSIFPALYKPQSRFVRCLCHPSHLPRERRLGVLREIEMYKFWHRSEISTQQFQPVFANKQRIIKPL